MLNLNDPLLGVIGKKYGKTAGTAWKVSNVAMRVSLAFFAIAILLLIVAVVLPTFATAGIGVSPSAINNANALLILNIASIVSIGAFLFGVLGCLSFVVYELSTVVAAFLMKDLIWAIVIFFINILVPVYKYVKGGNLRK